MVPSSQFGWHGNEDREPSRSQVVDLEDDNDDEDM